MWTTKKISEAEFNQRVPVGTPVRYYPVQGERDFIESKTRSVAWTLGHGALVVAIEGRTGGVLVQALRIDGKAA